tara:strand:+ start:1045 stop:2208 length:1164 start_codon:yes stop_codon:yes gene_type:complete
MGFFKKLVKGVKKVFKGVGKVFKKIGKGIKKAVTGIGKFMGKLGIVGQIGLSLLLPGIGSVIGSMAGGMMASTASGVLGAAIRGAGTVLNAAVNVGSKVSGVFKTVTEGVTRVVGNVAGAALNKIPGAGNLVKAMTGGKLDITGKTFQGAWQSAQGAITDVAVKGGDLFSMSTLKDPNKFIKPETLAKLGKTKIEFEKTDVNITAEDESILQRMEEGTVEAPKVETPKAEVTTQRESLLQRDPVSGDVSPTTENFQKMYDEDAGGFRAAVDANPEQYPGVVRASELPAGGGVMQVDASGKPQGLDPNIQPETFGQKVASAVRDRFDPMKGVKQAYAAATGQGQSQDITANDQYGTGYAVDFGAATIGYNPNGAMNYFPMVGNLRGVA